MLKFKSKSVLSNNKSTKNKPTENKRTVKLSKEKIKYIDEYLERSGVTYWDVRAELLDHFVIGIEQKMTDETLEFDEALEQLTIAFGNTTKKEYVLNKDNTQWIPVGAFSSGEAFKKLQREKQQQIGKKYRKAYGKQLYQLFLSAHFYIEFVLLILAIAVTAKYSEKWALGIGFLFIFYPFFTIAYNYIKGKIPKKSLHIQISMMGLFLWINLLSLIPNGYESIYDEKLDFSLFALLLIVLFPLIKASFIRYTNVCKEFKKYHDLIA